MFVYTIQFWDKVFILQKGIMAHHRSHHVSKRGDKDWMGTKFIEVFGNWIGQTIEQRKRNNQGI